MRYDLVRSRDGTGQEEAPPADGRRRRRRRREEPPSLEGAPIDVGRILRAARRKWWLVVGITTLAAGTAWWWARQQPTRYMAAAVVQLVDGRRAIGGGLAAAGDTRNAAEMTVLSQMEILRSRAVAAEVVAAQPLGTRVQASGFPLALLTDVRVADDAEPRTIAVEFSRAGWRAAGTDRVVPYGEPATLDGVQLAVAARPDEVETGTVTVLALERAADVVIGSADVVPRKATTLMDVTFIADDPDVALNTVNALVDAYQRADRRLVQQTLRRRREFIDQQMQENDAQLAEAERALSALRLQQQAYSSEDRFAVQRTELASLDAQGQEIDAERRLASDLLARLESGDAAARARAFQMLASSPLGATPVVSGLFAQLGRYESSRAEVTSGPRGFAATNPEVLRLDSLVIGTQQQIVGALQAHIALLDARLAPIQQRRDRTMRDLRTMPAANVTETQLSQDAQVLRDQAALLRTEYQHARIAEAAEMGSVDIVDLANRASPMRVNAVLLIGFAGLLGVLFGGGGAVALDLANRSIRDRDHLERELQLPVLATVPRMSTGPAPRRFRGWSRGDRKAADTAKHQSVALAVAQDVRAPSAEAFRQLRTNILFSEGGQSLRTLVVTSADPGEGKTSVAVNLAVTFAQQRMRVLLIDCDLLRPRVHRVFGLPVGPGFQQVILESDAPSEMLRATPVSGLFVMTAGTPTREPGDATGSLRLHAMLRDLANDFDMIILDSPPVLAVADTLSLGVAADAVLFVARAGKSRKDAAVEALRHLDDVNAYVVGAVLNDPDEHAARSGAYKYYDYSYAGGALSKA